MFERLKWIWTYFSSNWYVKIHPKLNKRASKLRRMKIEKYVGKRILSVDNSHKYIKDLIESNRPFAIGRNGQAEVVFLEKLETDRLFHTHKAQKKQSYGCFNNKRELELYYDTVKKAYAMADANCVWENVAMEEIILKKMSPQSMLLDINAMHVYEFFDYADCWTKSLKGKKVLVVSIYAEQIESQYKVNRNRIHKNEKLLPEFQLETVQSVWWFGEQKDNRFNSWFECLDYLENECLKKDFEIALISCSLFSFPLAVRLKAAGKQAIQVGGALQLLFGIRGKRWNHICEGVYYNDYWVMPDEKTFIEHASELDGVQGGPYW